MKQFQFELLVPDFSRSLNSSYLFTNSSETIMEDFLDTFMQINQSIKFLFYASSNIALQKFHQCETLILIFLNQILGEVRSLLNIMGPDEV